MDTFISIAKRENNNRRGFLIVNRSQAKHIAADPCEALRLFGALTDKVRETYRGISPEKLLTVGFAETATAIGAAVASGTGSRYIQTTRENVPGCEFLYFSEEHSHATEQRLVRSGSDTLMGGVERVLLVDDEITTGKTILNIIDVLRREFPAVTKFSAVSLLNGMTAEHEHIFAQRGIDILYLHKLDNSGYEQAVRDIPADGLYVQPDISTPKVQLTRFDAGEFPDARKPLDGGEYGCVCGSLCADIADRLGFASGETAVVIGTEEFMYPAIVLADELKKRGITAVSHSTTRSPIAVSSDTSYPLHRRYELPSFYERERRTFIYDLKKYDRAVILTDSRDIPGEAENALVNALVSAGNERVYLGRCSS
ncbi:MAG: phosphoribosyltransferase domain-containing protein [Ruminiclostridium sp.]|nr:phosphoribosyltransferase domain-containing protein [Ruminiclostridium sp.]